MKSISIVLIFVSLCWYGTAQEKKSKEALKAILDSLKDPIEQVEALHALASSNIKTNPQFSQELSAQMIEISIKHNYRLGLANGYYNIGYAFVYFSYPKATDNLIKAYDIYVELNNLEGQAGALLSLALVYQALGQKQEAIDAAQQAMEIALNIEDLKILSRTHTNLSAIYHQFDQTDSSLIHGKIALKLKKEIGDEYGVKLMLLNLGVFMANYDSLLDQGLDYLKEARSISTDPYMINDIVSNMVYVYSRKKNYEMAKIYMDSATLGNDSIDSDYTRQGLHRISKEMFVQIGDYENAFKHLTQEFKLDQQLRGLEVQKKFEVLQLENENQKSRNQIVTLEKEKAETYFKYTVAIFISVLVLLVGVMVFILMRGRIKVARLKQKELKLQIDLKNRELASFTLNFVQKNELISNIKEQINELHKKVLPESGKEINEITKIIDDSFRVDKEWENFKFRFEEVHEGFFKNLTIRYPDLGNSEMRLCALLRLNMTMKESSQVLGISPDSVKTARYRLRRKMGLSADDNLVKVISMVSDN